MHPRRSAIFAGITATALAVGAGCAPGGPPATRVRFVFPAAAARGPIPRTTAAAFAAYENAPASLDDFDCFAVSVIGSGIPSDYPHSCLAQGAGVGVTGGWVSTRDAAAAIELSVPSGPARQVRVYGVRVPGACPALRDFATSALGDVYLLGSATQDLYASATVGIDLKFDPRAQAFADCGPAPSPSANPDWNAAFYIRTFTSATLAIPLGAKLQSAGASFVAVGNAAGQSDQGATFQYDTSSKTLTYSIDHAFTGVDHFSYTVAVGPSGAHVSGQVTVNSVSVGDAANPGGTWIGAGSTDRWDNPANWCGGFNSDQTACVPGFPPGLVPAAMHLGTAIFDETCRSNCSPTIANTVRPVNLVLHPGFSGVITFSGADFLVTDPAIYFDLISFKAYPGSQGKFRGFRGGGAALSFNVNSFDQASGTVDLTDFSGPVMGNAGTINMNGGTFVASYLAMNVASPAYFGPGGTFSIDTLFQTGGGMLTLGSGTVHSFQVSTGTCTLVGDLLGLGSLTISAGATLNQGGHSIGAPSIFNNGTINP